MDSAPAERRSCGPGEPGRVFAVVLTGPPGAGKTSVLEALTDALSDDDVPHAAIEAEALRWVHPALSGEEEMRHLAAISALFRDAGHRLLPHGELVTVRDGKVTELVVYPTVDEALIAAGVSSR